ncbi:hypothetical protein NMG60_11015275 [Bertholletia excelsa]
MELTFHLERDKPLTPAGRLFLQPEMSQIINCIIGIKYPVDVDAIRSELSKSLMIKHPRFSSILVRDLHGREHWRKTQVDVERHIVVLDEPVADNEDAVNDYVADLSVSSPLPADKPLWELHLLRAHNCVVFRLHHALGDGISLMSMLLQCCRSAEDPDRLPNMASVGGGNGGDRRLRGLSGLWRVAKMAWLTAVFLVEFVLRTLWLSDRRTAVSGGEGVELWPRKIATAKFRLDDMKAVKKTVADATINDVIFGVISCGLSRYLDLRSPKDLQEGQQITCMAMVNLRKSPGLKDLSKLMEGDPGTRWGNRFGLFLFPVYYQGSKVDPLQHLKRAKAMIDQKKQSLEAHFSYKLGDFAMSCFGPKMAARLNYRVVCNTTFTFSNVVGPGEEIIMAGNPVTYIRVSTSSLPHAITMHMVSYAGRADMQILVAKDIIPDPEVLAKCFEDALLEMKEAAKAATGKMK